MQSGPSRELFELWAPDSRNGLIITGYSVEGTLARVSAVRLIQGRYLQHFLSHVYYTARINIRFLFVIIPCRFQAFLEFPVSSSAHFLVRLGHYD
jgi:predicted metal-dependent RNase